MIVSLHRLNNEQKAICFTCFSSAEIGSASDLFLAILLHQPVHKCSLPQPALQLQLVTFEDKWIHSENQSSVFGSSRNLSMGDLVTEITAEY